MIPLAHSSRDRSPDPYHRHVLTVANGARHRAENMLRYSVPSRPQLLDAIYCAGIFHDLGKLDDEVQAALGSTKRESLRWDHIDAGVAHLSRLGNYLSAWLVRAHHTPGLPEREHHFTNGLKLRGRRNDSLPLHEHHRQIARTDARLGEIIATHEAAVGICQVPTQSAVHGLAMRLALSCLVDADHTDTAYFDTGELPLERVPGRWDERLRALEAYLLKLGQGETQEQQARNARRKAFFEACKTATAVDPMVACEGPVGIGKTTAVTAYLLQRAHKLGLRHIIVVAPYTNILTQTARVLRRALTLDGERDDHVVMEHHHRADFSHRADRDMAVLWRAPIVVTTSVSLFETLSANDPSTLRKLHELPGSAIFFDEAHAALSSRLWPQNWRWLRELCEEWGCCMVFASGTLARFWEDESIVETPIILPELMPSDQSADVLAAERKRVHFSRLDDGRAVAVNEFIDCVQEARGPRLVILNTVQNAAIVAKAMRDAGRNVLHLSTALTPRDRERILQKVFERLQSRLEDWSLVATSCVEAGVDISFRCAFRERFSVSSLVQTGGRVNRNGEYTAEGGGIAYDFSLEGPGITRHPDPHVRASVQLLREYMAQDELNHSNPADLVTEAMSEEIKRCGGLGHDALKKAESEQDYPGAKKAGAVITADTCLVVVSRRLQMRLGQRKRVSFRQLLRGSVQLWTTRIQQLGMEPIEGRREIYFWKDDYDPEFLGYMAGVLKNHAFLSGDGIVV